MAKRTQIQKQTAKNNAKQLLQRKEKAEIYEKGLIDAAKHFAAGSFFPVDVAEGVTQGALTPPASYKAAMMRPPVPSDYQIDEKTGKPVFKGKPPVVNPEYKGTTEHVGRQLGVDIADPGGLAPQAFSPDPLAKLKALGILGKAGLEGLAGLGALYGGLKKVGKGEKAEDVAKPIFTSPGKLAAADISKETIPANKVKNQLEGRGVSKDEMEWTGFNDWIKTKKGEVSKAEIEEFFEQNQIQVQEVVREQGNFIELRELKKFEADMREKYGNTETFNWPEDVQKKLLELQAKADAPASQPRYPQKELQLPGGENYRELLLKLPGERGAEGGADGRVIFRSESAADDFLTHISAEGLEDLDYGRVSNEADIYNLLPPESVVVEFNNIPANDLIRFREVAETNRGNLTVIKTQQEPTSMFTGGHWDEPNVIAHIRFNERVDPDGNKVLFIEEIQSDWGKMGHDVGFKTPETEALRIRQEEISREIDKIVDELKELGDVPEGNYGLGEEGQKELDKISAQMNEWSARQTRSGAFQTLSVPKEEREIAEQLKQKMEEIKAKYDPNYAKKQELNAKRAELAQEHIDLSNKRKSAAKPIQPGPFVTDSHQWTNLALKRMIRWASDEGFDSIAWVTGKQSADRYNASKYVDSIYWNPDSTRLVAIEKGGNNRVINELVPEDKLADFIGKEPAKRLLKSQRGDADRFQQMYDDGLIANFEKEYMANSHSLEGADMNIGGEYHKFIYDKVLTDQAKKIGKKHGAKVEEGGVLTPDSEKYRDDLRNVYINDRMGQFEPVKIVDDPVTFRDEIADIYHTPDDVAFIDSNGEYVRDSAGFPVTSRGFDESENLLREIVKEEVHKLSDKELMKMFPDLEEAAEKVWTMRLTDKLKEASREGLPYYMVLPPLVIGGAAAQRTDAQRQQAKTDAQAILAQ